MAIGAFGENFPYSNFHDLNMDWIIKIAKDFLDQYTHLQETIETGETEIQELADRLQGLLEEAYDGYTQELADQLADALNDLNAWYTQHEGYLNNILAQNVASFQTQASAIGSEVIASIPSDYGNVTNQVKAIQAGAESTPSESAWTYFYGYGYFNASNTWTDNSGLATLKIPIESNEFVIVSGSYDFMSGISGNYRFMYEMSNGNYDRTFLNGNTYGTAHTDGNYEVCALGYPNAKYVYITVGASAVGDITVLLNKNLYANRYGYKYPIGIYKLDSNTACGVQTYFNENSIALLTTSHAVWKTVNAGDKLELGLVEGISYYGSYISYDRTARQRITTPAFTVPKDGFVCVFQMPDDSVNQLYIPAKRLKLYQSDIIGSESENYYAGLNGVAFGTSLTYRSQTTGGYLDYLPGMSEMTFDNQGVSSGKIKVDILNAIQSYTGYANKRVALIEGFCNDFGYNASTLGTYTDSATSTVCGCLRTAINYILSQNADITIFIVLDPYGRNYNGVDSSSTVRNSANMTQMEYYNELAKVAESLGVPVIPLYKISGISENTPQYLMDNIHPTALGALQTASAIWECMRRYYPNQTAT